MKYIILIFLLIVGTASAIVEVDPKEEFYKTYADIELSVMGSPVYVEEYYTKFLSEKTGTDIKPPAIAIMSTPINVLVTAKVPESSRFIVLENQDTQKDWDGILIKRESGFKYLEYHLYELGEWTFVLDGEFGLDYYSFFISAVQMTDNPNWGSSGSTSPGTTINVRFAQLKYSDGDQLTFSGVDVGIVSYEYMQQAYLPGEPIFFNKKRGPTIKVIKDGAFKSMTIPVSKGFFDKLMKNKFQLFIAIAVILFVAVQVMRKRKEY